MISSSSDNQNKDFENESGRKVHISRLPSATLLRSQIRGEGGQSSYLLFNSSSSNKEGSNNNKTDLTSEMRHARLILAQLKENANEAFSACWKKVTSKISSARFQMFRGIGDSELSIFILCCSSSSNSSSPSTTLPNTPGGIESPTSAISRELEPHQQIISNEDDCNNNFESNEQIRQSESPSLSLFGNDSSTSFDTIVSSLLSNVGSFFSSPPQVQQCVELVPVGDDSQNLPIICVERMCLTTFKDDKQTSLSMLVTEMVNWKFDGKKSNINNFIKNDDYVDAKQCDKNERKVSIVFHDLIESVFLESKSKMTLQLFEDLLDPRLFTIIYQFQKQEDVVDVRRSAPWRSWRRFLSPHLSGTPSTEHMIALYHWRDEEMNEIESVIKQRERIDQTPKGITSSAQRSESPSESSSPCSAAEQACKLDPKFIPHVDFIKHRLAYFREKEELLINKKWLGDIPKTCLSDIGRAYQIFGLNRTFRKEDGKKGWTFRDYMPNVKSLSLIGEFNNWNKSSHILIKEDSNLYGDGVWSVFIPDDSNGQSTINNYSKYKLFCISIIDGSEFYRVPAFSKFMVEISDLKVWDAMVTAEDISPYIWKNKNPVHETSPKIYEVFPGMTGTEEKIGTWRTVKENILPRMKISGFNTLLMRSVQEFECYSSAGWHVNSFFATSSRYGNPTELKELIDDAHAMNIKVIFSIIHSHVGPYVSSGLDMYDGTKTGGIIRSGDQGYQRLWDSLVPDFGKPEVMRMLLSSIGYFLCEFNIDGLRMEGVSSMMYQNHGVMTRFDPNDFGSYFNGNIDLDATVYLMLANAMVQELNPNVIMIANEHSRHPGISLSITEGGMGFTYSQYSHLTDSISLAGNVSWKSDYSLHDLVSSFENLSAGEIITVVDSFDSNIIGKRPLRIAMFAWETLHTHAVGGVAPHVTELAAALARQGHEVHIFTRATTLGVNHTIHYGVHYHECPFQLTPDFVSEINNMCESFIHQMHLAEQYMQAAFHICHAHDWLAGRALVIAKRLGKICVFTMHSTEFGRCGNVSYGGQSARIRAVEAEACTAADRVICVSGVLATEVRDLYNVHPEKIKVCYNGCDVGTFDGFVDAAPIKANYNIGALEPMLLFVGRLAVQKGPDLLIEAIPMILQARGDAKFVIVGDGHMKTQLMKRVSELNIGHAVRMVGSKSGAELYSLYKICDAVVVPSRNEPFGIVVLEAWAAYKPVVATTCGGPRDFVTPNENGYLVDPNPSSIAWGCCEILNDFGKARWMGEVAHEKALREFSWSNIALKTRDIYLTQICKADASYCESTRGDASLIQQVIGSDIYDHMSIFDPCRKVREGLGFVKLAQLMAIGIGSNGFSAFMGSEYGHPDFVDLPRASNQFTKFYGRRQWHLATDKKLKYKHLLFFNLCLMAIIDILKLHSRSQTKIVTVNEHDRVVAFQRGKAIFVLNFHPSASLHDYEIKHSISSPCSTFSVILNSDSPLFGGCGELVESLQEKGTSTVFKSFESSEASLKLHLPPMTGLILVSSQEREILDLQNSAILSSDDLDDFLDQHSQSLSETTN